MGEIITRRKIRKKMKRLATISNVVCTGLIITAVITGSISISAFTRAWALSVNVSLSCITIQVPLATADSQDPAKYFL